MTEIPGSAHDVSSWRSHSPAAFGRAYRAADAVAHVRGVGLEFDIVADETCAEFVLVARGGHGPALFCPIVFGSFVAAWHVLDDALRWSSPELFPTFEPVQTEAVCDRCGETFNPSGDEDDEEHPEHYATSAGVECGGVGTITGQWGTLK